jgi:DNA repair protein RadC
MEKSTVTAIRERPREKLFKYGPTYLSNEELIAVILGSGTRGNDVFCISKKVLGYLEENVSLIRENFPTFFHGLLKVKGLGFAKAALIAASCELQSRLTGDQKHIIKNAVDILPYISYLATKRQEYFVCINLNGGNRVMSNRVITIGLIDQALVHPREVFSDAVKEKAAKVIVAHNHPAGNSAPSNEDVDITNNLVKASGILGITFLDHIIITDDGYFSFREDGLL